MEKKIHFVNIYFSFTDCTKSFDCVDHNKLWNILKEMGITDHITCPLQKQGSSRKTSTSASLTMLKPLTAWITTNCGKF